MVFVANTMQTTITTVIKVSGRLRTSMETNTPTIVITADSICGMLWLITCHSYAIPSQAAGLQNQIAEHLPPESVYICENLQVILSLVRSGYGFSVLPETNFPVPEICYVPIRGISPLSYGIFYKKGSLSPFLKKFLSIVDKVALD